MENVKVGDCKVFELTFAKTGEKLKTKCKIMRLIPRKGCTEVLAMILYNGELHYFKAKW
jgi:hypothetical protein